MALKRNFEIMPIHVCRNPLSRILIDIRKEIYFTTA